MRGKANHRESALPDTIERTTIDRTQLRPSVAARGATPLAELRSVVARRFEDAVAMPPSVYTDAGFGERELERIFRREWICVGRAGGVAKPGDYLTYQVAGQPIAVIRGRDGELRAFSNVCLHRMSTLLEGAGNARAIVCPYHAWTYNLDGTLRAAPHMHKTTGFCKAAYRLPAIRCEAWRGWLYVTLNADAEAVSARLAPLDDPIADYAMEGYVETFREEHVWDTNWKVLAENFMESYHLPMLHWGTVGAHSKVDDMACPPGLPAFNYHWITKQASLPIGNAHPDNDRLRGRGRWRQTAALITVYPSHLMHADAGLFLVSGRPSARRRPGAHHLRRRPRARVPRRRGRRREHRRVKDAARRGQRRGSARRRGGLSRHARRPRQGRPLVLSRAADLRLRPIPRAAARLIVSAA